MHGTLVADDTHQTSHNHSLLIKPTDALNSNFVGITTLHISGSLSAHHQEFLAYIGFGTFYAGVMNRLLPGVGRNCLQFHPTPGSKRSSQLHKMYQSLCRLRTPDDGQKGCPKYVD